jgi:nucleoside-diphosphate-sugar epimerase
MKKIVILGASGFIGKNIALSLAKSKTKIVGTYLKNYPNELRNKINLVKCDLRNPIQVKNLTKKTDILIHCAATTSGAKDIFNKPYIHVTDNAIMNSVITRAAFENEIKHVIMFSCTVMYRSSKKPLKESDFNPNKEMYKNYFGGGWMKVFTEKMSEFYSRLGKNKYTVIRHSNIYGPYDKFDLEKSHVFGASITKVIKNKTGKVKIWGDGKEKRDLLYIDDLVDFVKKIIFKPKKNFCIYNIGLGKAISINELTKKIINISKLKLTVENDLKKKSLKNNIVLNCSLAKKNYGWKPKISIEEGITKTLNWYQKNLK